MDKGKGASRAQAADEKSEEKPRSVSRRRWLVGAGVAALGGAGVYLAATTLRSTASQFTFEIVQRYPHDRDAFTQGLVYYRDGILFEGTGRERFSELRKLRLPDMAHPVQRRYVPGHPLVFGEGIALWGDTIFQLTWKDKVVYVYDRDTFEEIRRFDNPLKEGWGLTHDGTHLIMSDGTSALTFLNPDTFAVVRSITVYDGINQIVKLNELEYIDGEIYANVWYKSQIARISPETGAVVAWLDLTGLQPRPQPTDEDAVLNGIAYDAEGKRLFVTGKWWPELFEIRQVPK